APRIRRRDRACVYGRNRLVIVLDRLERGIDEQRAIVITPRTEAEDEFTVAVHVVGHTQPRLERAVEVLTVVAVGYIILGIEAGGGPPGISPQSGSDEIGRAH